MRRDGLAQPALDAFAHHYRSLVGGATGMVPEADIEPHDMPALRDQPMPTRPTPRIATTAVVKLNGGLGHVDGAGSRQVAARSARDELTFLDVIARQVLALRRTHRRSAADHLPALVPHVGRQPAGARGLPGPRRRRRAAGGAPEPRPQAARRRPDARCTGRPTRRSSGARPATATCTRCSTRTGRARHAPRRRGSPRCSCPTPTTSARSPDPRWRRGSPQSGAPFAVEAVPPHRQRSQGRALRPAPSRRPHRPARDGPDPAGGPGRAGRPRSAIGSCRPTTCGSTWRRCGRCCAPRNGVLDLPLIRNAKTVDPCRPGQPAGRPAGDGDGCGHRAVRRGPDDRGATAIGSSP